MVPEDRDATTHIIHGISNICLSNMDWLLMLALLTCFQRWLTVFLFCYFVFNDIWLVHLKSMYKTKSKSKSKVKIHVSSSLDIKRWAPLSNTSWNPLKWLIFHQKRWLCWNESLPAHTCSSTSNLNNTVVPPTRFDWELRSSNSSLTQTMPQTGICGRPHQ